MKMIQKPKKSLGQHFLTSTSAVEKIVFSGDIQKEDTILEIGPGKGVLTKKLLDSGAHVIAIEKDDSLIPILTETFKKEIASGQLKLIHGDILKYDLGFLGFSDSDAVLGTSADSDQNVLSGTLRKQTQESNNGMRRMRKSYKLIANIPYYITGEIIRLFLTTKNKPETIVLLVQKEVAERIVAKDNKESVLSLSVKYFGIPTYIQTVKKGSFNPPPKVDSAIIKIEIRSKYEVRNTKYEGEIREEKNQEKNFFEMIKTGFKSKRKKLISNLSSLYAKDTLSRAFAELKLDENVRAEDVSLSSWLQLQDMLSN